MKHQTPLQIQRSDIFNIRFYQHTWFHGSFRGMHYRIEGITPADGEKQLQVTTWPGPYNFDHTPEEAKTIAHFPFSNEGLDEVTAYLNTFHQTHFSN